MYASIPQTKIMTAILFLDYVCLYIYVYVGSSTFILGTDNILEQMFYFEYFSLFVEEPHAVYVFIRYMIVTVTIIMKKRGHQLELVQL